MAGEEIARGRPDVIIAAMRPCPLCGIRPAFIKYCRKFVCGECLVLVQTEMEKAEFEMARQIVQEKMRLE